MKFPTHFISAGYEFSTFEKPVSSPFFRRSFTVEKNVKSAKLLICGLGFYELFVNGKNITKGPLAPYISNPNQIYYYDEYSPELLKGENVLGVSLGNGMQNSFGGYIWDFEKGSWRGAPRLALSLEIIFEDDEAVTIESGSEFLTHPSPTYFDELRCGEYYDARLELKGWSEPGFNDSGWTAATWAPVPAGTPALCSCPPIVITDELKAVSVTPVNNGYMYDFGINCAGVPKLTVKGALGQEISLEHGERLLEDGTLDLNNIKFVPGGYVQRDKYICSGNGTEVFVPKYTYHGFRYIFVTGITQEQAKPQLLTYLVMNTALNERGSFSCSNETANILQVLTRRSTLSNFYYFPTDCPHREKNGWTGDAAISAEHMLLNLDPEVCFSQWLDNIRTAQKENGQLPGIVPTGDWGYAWGNGPAWDCVIAYLPYYTYKYRGDTEILKENATAIFRYISYLSTMRDSRGLIHIGLGDWCPPGRGADDYVSPLEFTDSVIAMDICVKAEKIFSVIGLQMQSEFTRKLAKSLQKAIRENLIDFGTMTAAGCCQTSQSMAIFYSVFDEGEKNAAVKRLVEMIEDKDGHMDTGILGARVIFHVLSKYGHGDLALNMIVRKDFPSYGNWIERGATSLWEDFQKVGDRVNSLNHHFFGDISAWFIKRIGGIQLDFFKQDKLTVLPCILSDLTFAKASHICSLGEIQTEWTRDGDKVKLKLKSPIECRLTAPIGWRFEDGQGIKISTDGDFVLVKNK